MAESSNANTAVSGLKTSTEEISSEDTQSSRRDSSSGTSGKNTTPSQPDLPPSASKKRSAPEPAASQASPKAEQGGLRTKSRCIKRARKTPQTSSSDQEISNTDDTSSGEVEEVVMPSTTLDLATSKSGADKAATLAKPSAETQEPIASSSAAPMVLGESLVNTLERVALNVVQEIMKHKYSPSGPALGTHQGEIPLYTRPPLQYTMAAPQQQGSPAYVVYKVGGDPGDYQFLYEPPKEIPHGYVCTYVPDCNNWMTQVTAGRTATAGGIAGTGVVAGAGSSSGADAEKQAWLAKYATGTSHERSTSAAPTVDEITAIMRDQFGILPKKRMIGYSKPYPNEYDLIPLPPKYRLPDFTKFSGSEGTSSIEHVSRYLAQLGMVSASDGLRVRFFSQSLTGPAFGWYTSLPPDSVRTWKQLEEQFHVQYHSEATEAGIADLTQVRQRQGETVSEYIQRFRTVRNRCYSVRL
ncbi:hypothetical protein QYE76_040905 [Lolium multiflorum]|uniref:Retrotransposon gag domain-containing protein n=1 Tax=Lolium multiflorum TaxID=4521 RepID=A0AAD8WT67_LOLMU|nr:hypothetical protein QYE76_040905 [Lolium multiflorum]